MTRGDLPHLEAGPVGDDELEALFTDLGAFEFVVLAVSGGADSMALMHLVASWRRARPERAPKVEVVTVDHGLRPGSAREAHWVEVRARAAGLEHATLAWTGDKLPTGVQEAAREARYRLLAGHVERSPLRPAAIVTAHTEDDQAETVLMRLARGSGLDGLAGIPARRALDREGRVVIVRPLLAVAKCRLVATLAARGADWLEDPSNFLPEFERVRLRGARAALAELGLENERIALSARRLARAREALDLAAGDLYRAAVDEHGGVFAGIDRGTFRGAPAELRVRVLVRALCAFGGEAKAPRTAKIESLVEKLEEAGNLALTLGGCVVSAGAKVIRIFREPGRARLAELELRPGMAAPWDRRFRVSLAAGTRPVADANARPVVVRALGASAYAKLCAQDSAVLRVPARAAATLPSFWAGDELIAVPQLVPPGHALSGTGAGGAERCECAFIG